MKHTFNNMLSHEQFFEILCGTEDVIKQFEEFIDELGASFLLFILEKIIDCYSKYKEYKIKIKDCKKYSKDILKRDHMVIKTIIYLKCL